MCPRKVVGLLLVTLSAGIILAILLPAWIIVWILGIILVMLGISQLK